MQRFFQVYDIDFNQTYAFIVKFKSDKVLLALIMYLR